jgi:hypothetical protein
VHPIRQLAAARDLEHRLMGRPLLYAAAALFAIAIITAVIYAIATHQPVTDYQLPTL